MLANKWQQALIFMNLPVPSLMEEQGTGLKTERGRVRVTPNKSRLPMFIAENVDEYTISANF